MASRNASSSSGSSADFRGNSPSANPGRNTTRKSRACLARKPGLVERFNTVYGDAAHVVVRDYWQAICARVEVIDLNKSVPDLAGLDDAGV